MRVAVWPVRAVSFEDSGELAELLTAHGVDPDEVIDVDTGKRASVLRGNSGALKLDHLESLVRSGRAHGRTRQAPPETLARLEVVDGAVSADFDTGQYLAELVAGEARWLCSTVNAVPSGVVRHLAAILLTDASPPRRNEIAAMTDDEFWALLLTDPATAQPARTLRRDPAWPTRELHASEGEGIVYTVASLYLDMPLVEGSPLTATHPAFAELPTMPWGCRILPPTRNYPQQHLVVRSLPSVRQGFSGGALQTGALAWLSGLLRDGAEVIRARGDDQCPRNSWEKCKAIEYLCWSQSRREARGRHLKLAGVVR